MKITRPSSEACEQIISSEPTPEFAAQMAEEFQILLDRLNDDELRQAAGRRWEINHENSKDTKKEASQASRRNDMEIVYKEESYRIMGACFEAYKEMGCGFLEPVYQECLEMELTAQGISFVPQAELGLKYKGRPLKQIYIPDFICLAKIIVEIKAVSELSDVHRAQLQNYLKATGYKLGLLVNFGHYPKIAYERIVH